MSIIGSISTQRPAASNENVTTDAIRNLIAKQLRVDVERVTDEAHLVGDLGADWLDRLELMIAIEDRFAAMEIPDDALDQLMVVGDLMHYIESLRLAAYNPTTRFEK